MLKVNTHEAKVRLSELLAAVEKRGEVVIICRAGRPISVHCILGGPPSGKTRSSRRSRSVKILLHPFTRTSGPELPADRRAIAPHMRATVAGGRWRSAVRVRTRCHRRSG